MSSRASRTPGYRELEPAAHADGDARGGGRSLPRKLPVRAAAEIRTRHGHEQGVRAQRAPAEHSEADARGQADEQPASPPPAVGQPNAYDALVHMATSKERQRQPPTWFDSWGRGDVDLRERGLVGPPRGYAA